MTTPDDGLAARLKRRKDLFDCAMRESDTDARECTIKKALYLSELDVAYRSGQLITLADHERLVKEAVEACAEILDAKAADHDADAARFRGGSDPHHNRRFLADTAREYAAAIRARGVTG